MPSLETPPKSAPPNQPLKVRTGRYGELEEHELIHLLDSLDDERSKARFRESIYISIIIYLAIVWFLFYGPRVLFHQPRLINPVDVLKERDKQLTYLDAPKDLPHRPDQGPEVPRAAAARPEDPEAARRRCAKPRHQLRQPSAAAPTPAPRSATGPATTGDTAPTSPAASANPAACATGPGRSSQARPNPP